MKCSLLTQRKSFVPAPEMCHADKTPSHDYFCGHCEWNHRSNNACMKCSVPFISNNINNQKLCECFRWLGISFHHEDIIITGNLQCHFTQVNSSRIYRLKTAFESILLAIFLYAITFIIKSMLVMFLFADSINMQALHLFYREVPVLSSEIDVLNECHNFLYKFFTITIVHDVSNFQQWLKCQ